MNLTDEVMRELIAAIGLLAVSGLLALANAILRKVLTEVKKTRELVESSLPPPKGDDDDATPRR